MRSLSWRSICSHHLSHFSASMHILSQLSRFILTYSFVRISLAFLLCDDVTQDGIAVTNPRPSLLRDVCESGAGPEQFFQSGSGTPRL